MYLARQKSVGTPNLREQNNNKVILENKKIRR